MEGTLVPTDARRFTKDGPPAPRPSGLVLEVRAIRRTLIALAALLVIASVVNAILSEGFGTNSLMFVDLDSETNLPTWWQSGMLAASALVAAIIAATATGERARFRRHWALLALLLLAVSIDEASQMHELLILPVQNALDVGGALELAWVIPGAAVVAVLAVLYLDFVRSQGAALRRGLLVAATLYVGGALGGEILTAAVSEDAAYVAATQLEETLEIAGQLALLFTLLAAWLPRGRLTLATD